MEENQDIKKQVEEKFRQLVQRAETDQNLKKEVFNSIAKIEGIASFMDLFTNQFIKTEADFLNHINTAPDEADFSDNNNI